MRQEDHETAVGKGHGLIKGGLQQRPEDEADDQADEGIVELAHEIGQQRETEHQRHVEDGVLGEIGPHHACEDNDRV